MKKKTWYRLDNTAKIMPSTTTNLNTNVFRLVCTLKDTIDEKILQEALDKTLIEYPLFLYTMHTGLFWHYLEPSYYKPLVVLDNDPVCFPNNDEFLFHVTYYQKRINLEVYHVLSDGNGALEFFRYLVCTYLKIKENLEYDIPLNDSSSFEKNKDDFKKFDNSKLKIKFTKEKSAYKIKFPLKDNIYQDVIEVQLSVDKIIKKTKELNVTVTVYLTAILIKSIINTASIKDLKKSIGITLPVDLRNYFPSKTVRNFFYTVLISYRVKDINSLDVIIKEVSKQLKEQTTKENLQYKINSFMLVEKILFIRIIPNFVKDFVLKYAAKISKKSQTTVFSNLGLVKFPNKYESYINSLSVISSTDDMQLTAISFKDKINLTFSSHFVSKDIERKFVKELQEELNCNINIISNIGCDNYE